MENKKKSFPYDVPLRTALPYIHQPELLTEEFRDLVHSKMFSNRGPLVLRFEESLKDYLGNSALHVVTCANATVGAELVFRALELKGKVIVTPLSFISSVHTILNVGLEPIFADVDEETLCLSPVEVEKILEKNSDVKAVFPVHLYGNLCDVNYFDDLRKKHISVIYDSAHSFGVKKHGAMAAGFGDAEIFSFHATKLLSACEGGALVTRNAALAEKFKKLTNFGFCGNYQVDVVGTNGKMSEVHALFGLRSLAELSVSIAARLAVKKQYEQSFSSIPEVRILPMQKDIDSTGQYFSIFLHSQQERDSLCQYLLEREILACKYFYPTINEQLPYVKKFGGRFPVASRAAEEVLCLPIHALMRPEHAQFIAEQISSYFKMYRRSKF